MSDSTSIPNGSYVAFAMFDADVRKDEEIDECKLVVRSDSRKESVPFQE
jgi:hypothetical protein